MSVLLWALLRTIIFSIIGNTVYKWFIKTKYGIWFDMKMNTLLNKVTKKEHKAQLNQPIKVAGVKREKTIGRNDGGPSK